MFPCSFSAPRQRNASFGGPSGVHKSPRRYWVQRCNHGTEFAAGRTSNPCKGRALRLNKRLFGKTILHRLLAGNGHKSGGHQRGVKRMAQIVEGHLAREVSRLLPGNRRSTNANPA